MHVTVWRAKQLIGALPLYLKTHSYGEYIFDWGWADAASRLGISYYPKLVAMVPVTPVTGRRFLFAAGEDPAEIVGHLIDGCFQTAESTRASSIHLLFLSPEEQAWVAQDGRLMKRLSFQFHWRNQGYRGFEDFVADFRSSMRKKLRKERRVAAEANLQIEEHRGDELSVDDWRTLERLYRATCGRKGSHPYLSAEILRACSVQARWLPAGPHGQRRGPHCRCFNQFHKGRAPLRPILGRHAKTRHASFRALLLSSDRARYRPSNAPLRSRRPGDAQAEARIDASAHLQRALDSSPRASASRCRFPTPRGFFGSTADQRAPTPRPLSAR